MRPTSPSTPFCAVQARQQSALPTCPQPTSPFNQNPAPQPSHRDPVQPPQQRDVPPCHYCNGQHHFRNCVDLCTDLEDGFVSINNRERHVHGRAGQEVPLVPAARGDRMIRDYAHAGSPILSTLQPPPSACSSPTPPPARPVSPAPPSLTSPVSCSTDTYIHTAAITGTIDTADAGGHGAFRTISASPSRRATPSEIHCPPTTRHTTGTNAGAVTF